MIVETNRSSVAPRTPDPAPPLRVFGILPFRGLEAPKSRLSDALSIAERRDLALALVRRTARALCAGGVERVALVTYEERIRDLSIEGCSETILQERPGLNRAIREGQQWALHGGADALLIVLPDLPLLAAADVQALLALAHRDGAVIAPDWHGEGTNALLLSPPDAIAPAFGTGSAERHRLALSLSDVPLIHIQRPGTSLDLDTPEDLDRLLAYGHDWHEYLPALTRLRQPVPLAD